MQQLEIYWQLHWRIPSLEPGTALFGKGTFTDKSSYYDGIYIVNLLFAGTAQQNASYAYFDIYHTGFSYYVPSIPLVQTSRGSNFSGNTSQALVFDFGTPGSCVRVLDTVYADDPYLNPSVANLFDISDINTIKATPDVAPNSDIFGTEPTHNWCYYFEKADLARQMQEWETVLHMKDEADVLGYHPVIATEDLPFIEAYAHTNQWDQAYQLSLAARTIGSGSEPVLCNAWLSFAKFNPNAEMLAFTGNAVQEFCP